MSENAVEGETLPSRPFAWPARGILSGAAANLRLSVMETKEYEGKVFHLTYPGFLKIQEKEPNWWARGPKGTIVQVLVDPPPEVASGFAESIRNPYYARSPGVFIERAGVFKSAKIEGYERLARLALPNSSVEWRSWLVEGKLGNRNLVNIDINAVVADWHDGTIWADLIDSIEVVGVGPVEWFPEEPVISKPEPGIKGVSQKKEGVLIHLPKSLDYLLDLAFEVGSLSAEDFEDNPEFPAAVERHLKREMQRMAPEKARARVKADRERLWEWLQQYPADKYPETARLHVVVGALLYAGGIFR